MGMFWRSLTITWTLLFFIVCSGADEPRTGRAAKALLKIALTKPAIFQPEPAPFNVDAYRIFRDAQKDLLISARVLQSVVESKKMPSVSALFNSEQPTVWLRSRLDVRFPHDGMIMEILLFDDKLSDDELVGVLDAVVETYINGVVIRDKRRELLANGEFERALKRLQERYNKEQQKYTELAKELGGVASPDAGARRAILAAKLRESLRMERKLQQCVDDELIQYHLARLETKSSGISGSVEAKPNASEEPGDNGAAELTDSSQDTISGDGDVASPSLTEWKEPDPSVEVTVDKPLYQRRYQVVRQVLGARIQKLNEEQATIEDDLLRLSETSAKVEERKRDLNLMAEFVEEVSRTVWVANINLSAPDRVSIYQMATIEDVE